MKKIFFTIIILLIAVLKANSQWYQQNSGTNEGLYAVTFIDSLNGTVVGGNGLIIRTTNGGESWISQNSGTNLVLLAVSFSTFNIGTVVGDDGTILRTIDGGQIGLVRQVEQVLPYWVYK